MPTPYLKIYNHNGFGDKRETYSLPDDVGSEVGADTSPGRVIMAKATQLAGGKAVTFAHLFEAFNTTDLRGAWTWKPAGGGSTIHGLLDGSKTSGECLHFANALWFLARCPAPWGLGMPASELDRPSTYSGSNGKGFVSEHNGTYLSLNHNVLSTAGYTGQPLYYWANHKTVQYGDTWYDVCYKTTYARESDMAQYHLTDAYACTDKDGAWDNKDLAAWTAGKVAERSMRNGRYYYFRVLSVPQQTSSNRAYEGPITETNLEIMRMNARGLKVA